MGKPLIQPDDPAVVAIASDVPLENAQVPVVGLDDIDRIAEIMVDRSAPLDDVLVRLERT